MNDKELRQIEKPIKSEIIQKMLDFGWIQNQEEVNVCAEHALTFIATDCYFRDRKNPLDDIPLLIAFDGASWRISYNGVTGIGLEKDLVPLLYDVILNQDKIYSGDFNFEAHCTTNRKVYERQRQPNFF